jgi:hypothetical protein
MKVSVFFPARADTQVARSRVRRENAARDPIEAANDGAGYEDWEHGKDNPATIAKCSPGSVRERDPVPQSPQNSVGAVLKWAPLAIKTSLRRVPQALSRNP